MSRLWARFVGLSVAVAVTAAATQFLTLGFETKPLIGTDTIATVTDWMRRPPQAGAGILAAMVVVLAGIVALIGGLWPRRGPSAIVTRRRGGWTRVDRKSLESTIQRRLESIDRRSDLKTSVHRSGRVDVDITTIDTAPDGPAFKLRETLDHLCDERRLPCKSGTVTINGRRPTANRRHAIQ